MVSWFSGWRSDRCADFRAEGIKKWHFCFFFNSYRSVDSKTFFGLKIEPLLTEIWPLLCSKFKYHMNPLKTSLKIASFFLASFPFSFPFFFPTDRLEILQMGKNCHFQNFILFFYFRPTDCMKRAREKSAIQGINRPWPNENPTKSWDINVYTQGNLI